MVYFLDSFHFFLSISTKSNNFTRAIRTSFVMFVQNFREKTKRFLKSWFIFQLCRISRWIRCSSRPFLVRPLRMKRHPSSGSSRMLLSARPSLRIRPDWVRILWSVVSEKTVRWRTILNRCIRCLLLMMLRLSEPRLNLLDGYFWTCPENFLSQRKPALNFCWILHFYNKILTNFALIF